MIIKTNWIPNGFDAITIYPFIFIKPEYADDKGLIAHELVHYDEQGFYFLFWWIEYLLSKKFRLDAEVRAYQAQIEMGGISRDRAAFLLTKYKTGTSIIKAYELLEERKTNEFL